MYAQSNIKFAISDQYQYFINEYQLSIENKLTQSALCKFCYEEGIQWFKRGRAGRDNRKKLAKKKRKQIY